MEWEIECENLGKDYGDFTALKDLNLKVAPGEVFGFLGPNGAGKTTTIRLLMGMLKPTTGSASIHDLDCHKDRESVKVWTGYLPDDPQFYDYLRGREILEFVGEMHGLKGSELTNRVQELLEKFSLDDAAEEYATNYSKGMKAKLALSCAQIHKPKVYIMDEPTNGLDPPSALQVRQWIKDQAREGGTIFLSTHLLHMAEKVCHRVGIIHQGRLLTVGTPEELAETLCPGGSLEEVFFAVTTDREEEKA